VNRWWANRQDSVAALKVVDDSDVVNGVGVAVLGYHGLAKSLLEPLASQTLVDAKRVRDALSEVDLEPVSKALGEATKPVMGEASEKYGQLLAEAIHKRAIDSTERLLLSWTGTGMPWPQAIEKAAEVHGVPLERLGRYAHVMKAVGITPLVRADYADRELMAYAAHIGQLESTADNALIEKQQKVKFNEEDHPRHPNGEFREKNATVSQISEKTKRLDRFNRLNNLNEMNRANLASIKSRITSVKEAPKEELKQEKLKDVQIKSERIANPKLRMETLKNALVPAGPKEPSEDDYPNEGEVHKWAEDVYIPIGKEVLEEINIDRKGTFFAGQLKSSLEAVSFAHLHEFIGTNFGGIAEFNRQGMTLMKSSETPVIKSTMDNVTGSHYEDINKDTDYAEVSKKSKFVMQKGLNFIDIADPNDRYADTEPFQVTFISLDNGEYKEFSKNLQGNNLQQFNEEHPRSADGRFTDKPNVVDLKQQRLERFNRINNLNNLSNQNRAMQMKRLVEAQKEVQAKVDIARERLQERPIASERIKGESIRSEALSEKNPPPKTDIELNDKWAMIFGFDAPNIGENPQLVANRVKDNLLHSDDQSYQENNPSNLVAVRPFINNNIDNSEAWSASEDNGFVRLVNYVDAYRTEKGWEGELVDYAKDGPYKHFVVDSDLTIPEIMPYLPERKYNGDHSIWQPQMFRKPNTDLSEIAWVAHPKEDDVQIVLGTEQEFQALKKGNATITKVDEIHCLMDLMTGTKIDGKKEDIIDAFDMSSMAGDASIGTNPPVSAYTIKIGNNGK
jgi:hypothetical protein